MGFEFGFKKRMHVVKSRPEDWETTSLDLTSFILEVNSLKIAHPVFQEDAPTLMLNSNNPNILLMWKGSVRTNEECLIVLNKDILRHQSFCAENLQKFLQAGAPLIDISPGHRLDYIPVPFCYDLKPGQAIVLVTARDLLPDD